MTTQTPHAAAPIASTPDAPTEPGSSDKGRPEAAGVQRPDQGGQAGVARDTPKHSTGGEGAAGAGGAGGFGN